MVGAGAAIWAALINADTVRTQRRSIERKLLATAYLLAAPRGLELRYADPERRSASKARSNSSWPPPGKRPRFPDLSETSLVERS
jgi:hypothetical protein